MEFRQLKTALVFITTTTTTVNRNGKESWLWGVKLDKEECNCMTEFEWYLLVSFIESKKKN